MYISSHSHRVQYPNDAQDNRPTAADIRRSWGSSILYV